jgi:hypothetical protein
MRPAFAATLERIEGNGVRTMGDKVTSRTRVRRPKNLFLKAGIIFAVVALAHALRIYMEWPVTIANWSVPKLVSWIALIVAGGLALFAFRFITENGEHRNEIGRPLCQWNQSSDDVRAYLLAARVA